MKKILDKNVVHSDLTRVEEIEIVHPAIALSRDEMNVESIKSFTVVNSNHWYYSSDDGVLYTRDKKTLIRCPVSKEGVIEIPEGVEEIEYQAFWRCRKITRVKFPSTLKNINSEAFASCSSLKDIEFNSEIQSLGSFLKNSVFFGCNSLINLKLPNQIRYIGKNSFSQCENLKYVELNEGLECIYDYAFYLDDIESVTLPDSLIGIGYRAFSHTKELRSSHYIPGTIESCTSYMTTTGFVKLNIAGNEIYIPRHVTKEMAVFIENNILSDNYNIEHFIYKKVDDIFVKQYIAFQGYKKEKNDKLEAYLRRCAKSFLLNLLNNNYEKDLIQFIDLHIASKYTLKNFLPLCKDNILISAKIMNELQNAKHGISFSI